MSKTPKVPKKISKFKATEAACMMMANKLFSDYITASSVIKGVEPEHFAEDWMKRNITKPGKLMERSIWRYFIEELVEYRKRNKRG